MWRDVTKDKSHWMARMLNYRFYTIFDHFSCLHSFWLQCSCLCHDLYSRINLEHCWQLFLVNSFRTLQRYEEKTSNNPFNCLHFVDNNNDSDSSSYIDKAFSTFVLNNSNIGILLVHNKLHTIWSENIEKSLWMLPRYWLISLIVL